ncbi:MAG: DUF4340 domain-containing protein [Alphaproteobacteria bacterium]|nr:DUF4340 domain-containing protein [Alphaproteobacteria bacterium]
MTAVLARERRGAAAWTIALAVVLAIAAWFVVGWDAAKLKPPPAIGLVAPDFAARPEAAQAIIIVTREGTYRIAKTPKGWTMTDRGAYPIKVDRMDEFTKKLAALSADRPLTRDPKKHARLGVDDPAQGGAGVRLQVQDAQGALLANLVLSSFSDRQYLRRNAEPQVWAGSLALPNLREASAWLDLTPYAIPSARIARVDVAPPVGAGYAVVRPDAEIVAFQLGRPLSGKPLAGGMRPSAVAAALGALNPIDVAPAPSITGAPSARAILYTTDGLAIDAELFVRGDLYWVKLGARATSPTAEAEAQALNARIGPWAYGLTALDYAALAPPLADAVVTAAETTAALTPGPLASSPAPAAPRAAPRTPAPARTAPPTPPASPEPAPAAPPADAAPAASPAPPAGR